MSFYSYCVGVCVVRVAGLKLSVFPLLLVPSGGSLQQDVVPNSRVVPRCHTFILPTWLTEQGEERDGNPLNLYTHCHPHQLCIIILNSDGSALGGQAGGNESNTLLMAC